ncbi:MAG: hypothetical protein O3A60_04770 [Planctomycetota bacterium]|nr:hypothetical protein [Planctomycetota bacterium]
MFRRLAVAMLAVGLAAAVLAFNARPLRNALRPEIAVMGLPAWDAAEQPLTHMLAAVASALPAKTAASPKLEFFARLGRDYDQQGGAVVAASGEVYCLPSPAGTMLVIDPASRSIEFLVEDLGDDASKAYGGVLAPNGKIYSGASITGRVIVLDRATDAISFIEVPRDRYTGSVLGGDGRIYSVPSKPGEVLVIDPATDTADLLPGSRITGGFWGAVLTPYGSIIAVPWESNRVLAIDFGSRLPADWPLSRLFNKY